MRRNHDGRKSSRKEINHKDNGSKEAFSKIFHVRKDRCKIFIIGQDLFEENNFKENNGKEVIDKEDNGKEDIGKENYCQEDFIPENFFHIPSFGGREVTHSQLPQVQ